MYSPQRRHCILPSSLPLLHTLTDVAPPISVLIKARAPESIRSGLHHYLAVLHNSSKDLIINPCSLATNGKALPNYSLGPAPPLPLPCLAHSMFHPDKISALEAKAVYDEVSSFASQHEAQCTSEPPCLYVCLSVSLSQGVLVSQLTRVSCLVSSLAPYLPWHPSHFARPNNSAVCEPAVYLTFLCACSEHHEFPPSPPLSLSSPPLSFPPLPLLPPSFPSPLPLPQSPSSSSHWRCW